MLYSRSLLVIHFKYSSVYKRHDTNELIYKTEIDPDLEKELMVEEGRGGEDEGRDSQGVQDQGFPLWLRQ